MKNRHRFTPRSINVREAFAYGLSDIDEVMNEILATENIRPEPGNHRTF